MEIYTDSMRIYVEALFEMLDRNKRLRYESTTENQRKQLDKNDKQIMRQLNSTDVRKLYE